jgi:hypothetical protein
LNKFNKGWRKPTRNTYAIESPDGLVVFIRGVLKIRYNISKDVDQNVFTALFTWVFITHYKPFDKEKYIAFKRSNNALKFNRGISTAALVFTIPYKILFFGLGLIIETGRLKL